MSSQIQMRTLTKAKKKTQKKKVQAQKPTKSVFMSPFLYKIQAICYDSEQQMKQILLKYLQHLRKQLPIVPQRTRPFISFSQKKTPQTLVHKDIVVGVKQCFQDIIFVRLLLVFYQQKCHEKIEKLLFAVVHRKVPYIIARPNKQIALNIGMKRVLCMGLKQQINELYQYCSKCSIEIPYLIRDAWIPLSQE